MFKGISGILSAEGGFGGSLGRIDIHGQTDIPKFTATVSGNPVPLQTTYHTIVDGTNGNTYLERIDASFLKTAIVAHGSVIDTPGVRGRTVKLDVRVVSGRIEDLMRLAVKAPRPVMVGNVTLSTTFVLPGATVRLAGRYALRSEAVDFKGVVTMDAKMSQLTSGAKRLVLRLVDPIFRRHGHTLIPIKITGALESPSVGLDRGRVFRRSD